ncbi:hypothetical protein BSKO_01034 [Bryopsis sp. KO-2023]|nr:hypothetical protein BSKO_01034 [Bryopsis sp. KO-2023]
MEIASGCRLCGVKPTSLRFNRCRYPTSTRASVNFSSQRRREVQLRGASLDHADLQTWLQEAKGIDPPSTLKSAQVAEEWGSRIGYVATRSLRGGEVVCEIPGDVSVTMVDACDHPLIGYLARDRSELIALTLWLMAERSAGSASSWRPFLETLPDRTMTPILWTESERKKLLSGSPVQEEAEIRINTLKSEWQTLEAEFSQDREKFPLDAFNQDSFFSGFSVIMSAAIYLPSAKCFALLPSLFGMKRTGFENGAAVDYDLESGLVQLIAQEPFREGQEVCLFDGRPNSELMLSTGTVEERNPSDFIEMEVSLVQSDRLYMAKREILETMDLQPVQKFPVYENRMPIQLLSYVRLSRVGETGQLTRVNFQEDVEVSQMNEYEVLQLLLGECRTGLARYETAIEEDIKDLQSPEMEPKARLARNLVLGEKRILQGTLDSVRKKLAPIRGIPTKSGLTDPNQDIIDVFTTIEDLPKKPKEMLDGFMSWVKGEDDPSWGKKNKR